MYFDSHAHYDDKRFDPDRSELLKSFPEQGIVGVINVGASMASSHNSVALAEKYHYIYATVGVHPHDASDIIEDDMEVLRNLCTHKKVVGVGEIGLDFHYDNSPRDQQRKWFAKQLELARSLNMPVVIHSREAAAETLKMIKDSGITRGVLHCYSGHLPMALEYIDMGFYIGIGGVITYKNANKTQEVAAKIPLDRLLIETDAPYLTPIAEERVGGSHKKRKERNDSTKLSYVAETIAKLRNITPEDVAEATAENVRRLFRI